VLVDTTLPTALPVDDVVPETDVETLVVAATPAAYAWVTANAHSAAAAKTG